MLISGGHILNRSIRLEIQTSSSVFVFLVFHSAQQKSMSKRNSFLLITLKMNAHYVVHVYDPDFTTLTYHEPYAGLKNEDPVVQAAFQRAIRKVYWSSIYSVGGTEEQVCRMS